MGCGMSKMTVVQPLMSTDLDETGTKPGMECGRGDSAGSKGTTDSGVIMESGETLPGAIPRKLPTLIAPSPDLLQESNKVERLESSEILEQLLSQGIIQAQPRENTSGAGEAYNIMIDERGLPRRKLPLRLESLKDSRHKTSKEAIAEKMRQAEERHSLREDELKGRLMIQSTSVHGSGASILGESEEDTPVEDIQSPPTLSKGILSDPLLRSQVQQAEMGEREVGDGEGETSERQDVTSRGGVGKIDLRIGRVEGDGRGGSRVEKEEIKELQYGVESRKDNGVQGREVEGIEDPSTFEMTTVEELKVDQMDLEKDSSFQTTKDSEYIF